MASAQREKYAPSPKPTDECQCTRATAKKPFGEVTHHFPYAGANGTRLYSRFRYRITDPSSNEGDKTFRYCPHYDRTNGDHVSLPYGLPRVKELTRLRIPRAYLVEGEPDCEATWALADEYATTTHLGTRFPLECAEHFRGYQGVVYIVVDRDHLDPEHQERFNSDDPAKQRDYPGAASALRRWRAMRHIGVKCFFREARKGKDMRDHLEAGYTTEQLRKVTLDQIKERAPREASSKRSLTLQLSQADLPEGPAMQRFIKALEAKGHYLEKIGPTRYKTNCPHPEHDDHNPSFEFEQGTKGVAATCESNDCTVGKGMGEICRSLGIRVKDMFDATEPKAAKASKDKPEGSDTYCPDPSDPMEVARYIQDEWVNSEDGSVGIMYVEEDTWVYNGTNWESIIDGQLKSRLYRRMDNELTLKLINEEWKPVRWSPAPAKISALTDGVRAINARPHLPAQGTWLAPPEYQTRHIAMANGLFDVERLEMRPSTPRYFNTWSLPYDFDENAECPVWEAFLEDVFEGDPDSIRTLKQWFGYLVSGRTDLEKILAIIGPTRSGKGTIFEVMAALVGERSTQSFTMKHLAGEFGLQNFIGKTLVCDPDMRHALKPDEAQAAIERLLSISANDLVVVNRKNRLPISIKLGVRPVILSNELPRFMDSSNALNARMVMLKMRKSKKGHEDHTLKVRLVAEIQGIFNWALDGLDDLNEAGKLVQPASALNYLDTMEEGASKHEQFLEKFCSIGSIGDEDSWCQFDHLKLIWKSWCEANETKPGNPQWLLRDMAPIITRLGGEIGKGWRPDGEGGRFRVITGISINESSANGPKVKTS